MNIIHVEGLTREYGATRALRGVDLTIADGGQIVGLLGPNGAGKTTLVEILEGLRARSAGSVTVLGLDPAAQSSVLRTRIGVQLQSTAFVPELTAYETLRLYASLYPHALPPDTVLAAVDLSDKRAARVHTLSGGQKQRLALAMAMLHEPELFILDEPTSGLDPVARRQIHDILIALRAKGKTVLLSSHHLDEIEALADRVIILRQGEIVADGTPLSLLGQASGTSTLWCALDRTIDDPGQFIPGSTFVGFDGEMMRYETSSPTQAVLQLADTLRGTGATLLDLRLRRPTLEDLYVQLVGSPESSPDATTPPHTPGGK